MEQLTEQQLTTIEQQIGRAPVGIVRIAAQSPNGVPLALQMRSVVDNKPFPTLYWLSSKTLSKAIGTIETQGWVKSLEERLRDDQPFREAYLECQRSYVQARTDAMLPEDREFLRSKGLDDVFAGYGIGGIANWQQVRCLHMQYAHHLADYNVIGEWLDAEFGLNALSISQ